MTEEGAEYADAVGSGVAGMVVGYGWGVWCGVACHVSARYMASHVRRRASNACM